ncbi:unnamed protein product, partial [Cyprideis torosa]
AAHRLVESAVHGPVALLFGPERFGLSNEHLKWAHYRVTIPANPDYPSLNLAAAVQLMGYEIYKAGGVQRSEPKSRQLPTAENLERFYAHLESTMSKTGFINRQHPGKIMDKCRHLFARAELSEEELNILRGMLTSVERCVDTGASE